MDTINDFVRRGALVDAVAPRLRAASGAAGCGTAMSVAALLGRRVPSAIPLVPGTPLPAHRRVLTT